MPMQVPHRKPGQFTHLKPDPLLTEAKYNELKNKLEYLKNKARPEAAAEVRRLAELGDFSENVEYQLAKGRLRGINNRITTIESHLNTAEIIPVNTATDKVQIGHTVTVENEKTVQTYQILGSSQTNPRQRIISHQSPLGAALLGHKVGDTVEMRSPGGIKKYRISKIE